MLEISTYLTINYSDTFEKYDKQLQKSLVYIIKFEVEGSGGMKKRDEKKTILVTSGRKVFQLIYLFAFATTNFYIPEKNVFKFCDDLFRKIGVELNYGRY